MPVLLLPMRRDQATDDKVAVTCGTGQVAVLAGPEGRGWSGLVGQEARAGRVVSGWLTLSRVSRDEYAPLRLWLSAPLRASPSGRPVDLSSVRWPSPGRRENLAQQVASFPHPRSGSFPDPEVLRANIVQTVHGRSATTHRSRLSNYAEGILSGAYGHGSQHPPKIYPRERRLWFYLRQMPVQWIPQVPIGGRRMDLFCPEPKTCVEIDGTSHLSERSRADDACRDQELKRMQISTIRVTNGEVDADPIAVAERIGRQLAKRKNGPLLRGWRCSPLQYSPYLPPSLSYLGGTSAV
ncbi:DUF559 domain-containing protein [Frankia sp. CH37]|nr:DUF559 domain-containing protein [Parafrankia sp. CH37]